MPKTLSKRKNGNGKLTDEGASREVSFARSAKLLKLPEVPLVVTSEAAACACASTSLIVTFWSQLTRDVERFNYFVVMANWRPVKNIQKLGVCCTVTCAYIVRTIPC